MIEKFSKPEAHDFAGKEAESGGYNERYRSLIERLHGSRGKFRVERTEEVKPGVHRREYDWQIDIVGEEEVTISKKDSEGKVITKEVPLNKFVDWQFAEVAAAQRAVLSTAEREGIKEYDENSLEILRIKEKVYKELRINPELLEIFEIAIQEKSVA